MCVTVDSGISMALKVPSTTLKKECAAILESMKVSFIYIISNFMEIIIFYAA